MKRNIENEMPDENNKWIEFKDYHKQMEVPCVVFAAFETTPTVDKKDRI